MANTNTNNTNQLTKKYVKIGIVAAIVVIVAIVGICTVRAFNRGGDATIDQALSGVSTDAETAAGLRMAVVRMDAIQMDAVALKDLRAQKEKYESRLRDELTKEQKALEKEKSEIEKSQDVLSRDALARRVSDYQNRVGKLQRDLAERAQSIEASYQKALNDVQKKHLDPIIEGIIAKKNLGLVIDGRFARVGETAKELDITSDVVSALDKRVSKIKMDTPKGF
ncbi:MAG: OmpH family outer membrane protein [Alphaproteobacteria bacterium]|nr:OmpH family outer membrane protein [Alphaproteobacteria bacterium]